MGESEIEDHCLRGVTFKLLLLSSQLTKGGLQQSVRQMGSFERQTLELPESALPRSPHRPIADIPQVVVCLSAFALRSTRDDERTFGLVSFGERVHCTRF